MQQQILIGGHRGLGATDSETAHKWRDSANLIPENTLEGLTEALRRGADFIEFDAVSAKDGLVVAHNSKIADHFFDRPDGPATTNLWRKADLAKHKVGWRGHDTDRQPTFEAALQAVKPLLTSGKFINVEVKELQGAGLPFTTKDALTFSLEVFEAVAEAGLIDQTLFSSFNPDNLLALAKLGHGAQLGMLFENLCDEHIALHGGEHPLHYRAFKPENVEWALDTIPDLAALNPPVQAFAADQQGIAALATAQDWCRRHGRAMPALHIWANREESLERMLPLWRAALDACRDVPRVGLITDYTVELRAALNL